MKRLPTVLALLAILAVVVLLVRLGRVEDQLKALRTPPPPPAPVHEDDDDEHEEGEAHGPVEVAHYMGRIQHYAHKLYWAGKAGNQPLAEFYRHEMDEDMEDIANAHVVDDGVDVSKNMEVYGIRGVDALGAAMKEHGVKEIDGDMGTMIATCNSCHIACGHPELRMTLPATNRFNDQDFTPVH